MPVVECDPTDAKDRLRAAGVEIQSGNTEHERWRATHGEATAVAYDDKVVVQGSRPMDLLAHIEAGPSHAYLYFDGASRGNPGPAAVGWVLVADGGIIAEAGRKIGRATNNQAEYTALIEGLEAARNLGIDALTIHGDSELIVKQVNGEYDTNNPTLREQRVRVHEVLADFDRWDLSHVPRNANERADQLANEAFDG